ncbi:hypothetical protein CGI18_07150 [Vibrio parahaemolyticus]|uniref:hypothetical protein n=1 Tax=Vibrio parahaemolyticus TaxID=670 RepID=UPI001120DF95|nr:hypothetical protein [Vibrio parahaemolyticus]TOK48261.1 hypothetical protein CGI18_07150 [Vibrio parahaemolyticus]
MMIDKTQLVKSGSKRGRKPAINEEQFVFLKESLEEGYTLTSIAKALGISYPTAHRYSKMDSLDG